MPKNKFVGSSQFPIPFLSQVDLMNKLVEKSIEVAGRPLSLQTGKLAGQTDAAVEARYGDTVLLATVATAGPRDDIDYFPLSVEYEERLYAGGRISSSRFIKREGRPTETAVLTGRLIDRSIRPLFPKDYFNEVQVMITVLSVDQENDPSTLALIAASAALSISSIPWDGPIAAVRVGTFEDKLIINPSKEQSGESKLNVLVASNKDLVVMIEADAIEAQEDAAFKAISEAFENTKPIIGLIEDFAKEVGREKQTYETVSFDKEKGDKISAYIKSEIIPSLSDPAQASDERWSDIQIARLHKEFGEKLEVSKKELSDLLAEEFKVYVRSKVLDEGVRLDGRGVDEVRPLSMETGLLPRTHGSGLFNRGATQVLSVVTLGSPSLQQLIESMNGEETKKYMHHYNFPPFSTGEAKRVGSPGRREIGHGALAEKALTPVLPSQEDFPYAIRVVSEVLSSSGSTSMAAASGSSLALMDAGVPISSPVTGIAIGLITDEKKYVVMTDIAYSEDANGDMDFKVAGTKNGITAIQLDMKVHGISFEIVKEALDKAKTARLHILEEMTKAIDGPRKELSQYAPRVESIKVDPTKIGQIIGSGGKVINEIIAKTGAAIDIDDDGTVTISGVNPESIAQAKEWVESLVKEVKPGEVYEGEVKRLMTFGAFVEVLPGKEGLVHISQMAPERVEKVEDVVSVGQKVKVRVIEIDDQHRINLSMLFGNDIKDVQPREPREGQDRGGRRPFDRNRGRR